MYKLIASDIDGTLINSKFEITQYTKEVIRAAINKGVHFALASGRIYGSAKVYASQLELDSAVLCCNGAVAKSGLDGKLIFGDPLNKKSCRELFELFIKDGTFFQFYGEETFYAPEETATAKAFLQWNKDLPPADRIPIEIVKDPFEALDREPIYKIFIISEGDKQRAYHKALLQGRTDVDVTSSAVNNYEITNHTATKANGVMKYGATLGIKPEEIICIGDNLNDEAMIRAAGLGIAMGNAVPEIKNIAKYITDTCDNDGVAKAIEKFIL